MSDLGRRLQKLEAKRTLRKRSGLSSEQRRCLTDRAVFHGDQEALRALSVYRLTPIPEAANNERPLLLRG
jgi:hypothetical protein